MKRMMWLLLPMTILLVGCPGPEDQGKLDAISSFEGFVDKLLQKLGPDLEAGRGFSLADEGGGSGTLWSLALTDYMVRPLAQPADSWLADIHITLVRASEKCSRDQQPIEVYFDFTGDIANWTAYSSASRLGSTDGKANTGLWRVWEPDSEDWRYLAECVAAISSQQETGNDDGMVGTTPGNQEVSE